jgi:hypothetical protein
MGQMRAPIWILWANIPYRCPISVPISPPRSTVSNPAGGQAGSVTFVSYALLPAYHTEQGTLSIEPVLRRAQERVPGFVRHAAAWKTAAATGSRAAADQPIISRFATSGRRRRVARLASGAFPSPHRRSAPTFSARGAWAYRSRLHSNRPSNIGLLEYNRLQRAHARKKSAARRMSSRDFHPSLRGESGSYPASTHCQVF